MTEQHGVFLVVFLKPGTSRARDRFKSSANQSQRNWVTLQSKIIHEHFKAFWCMTSTKHSNSKSGSTRHSHVSLPKLECVLMNNINCWLMRCFKNTKARRLTSLVKVHKRSCQTLASEDVDIRDRSLIPSYPICKLHWHPYLQHMYTHRAYLIQL